MIYTYDNQNVFAKIIRGEIPNKTAAENETALAFFDIAPLASIHILVIPKGAYVNFDDYLHNASSAEKEGFDKMLLQLIHDNKLTSEDGTHGYRVISNSGAWGMQEVPHYHVHLLAGEKLGPLLAK